MESDLERALANISRHEHMIDGCNGRVKWAAKNSVFHLKMAAELINVDPLISAFRAICAEEEAAAALIFSLKRLNYEGAAKIQFKSHHDKQAVIFFIHAVREWVNDFKAEVSQFFSDARLYPTEVNGRHAVGIYLPLVNTDKAVHPIPPLSLNVQGNSSWDEIINRIVAKKCDADGFIGLKEYVEKRANFRNELLYATDKGIPSWKVGAEEFVANQCGIVEALLFSIGLIDPWGGKDKDRSPIVESCIAVFLKSFRLPKKAQVSAVDV